MVFRADYIIVGGGTSGCVVANRLSEDPGTRVLVLEAGADLSADPRVNIPALWTTLLGSDADWQYRSVAQDKLAGRSIAESQGKLLGGSSAINGQAFIAPAQADIDAWSTLGNPGWDWVSLLPFYKKAYTLHRPMDQETLLHLGLDWIEPESMGTNGPIQVSFPGVKENPFVKAWIDAFQGMGRITSGDPFSGKSIGGYSNIATVDPEAKIRSYAGSAYGITAEQRPNVELLMNTKVTKVLFHEEKDVNGDAIAIGVEVTVDGGPTQIFYSNKEVILAAGVFNTPKLLELSGVGQKNLLKEHGIPVIIDMPGVGENMQDHLMTGLSYEVADGLITGDPLLRQEPEAIQIAQKLYAEQKAGPFTIGGIQSHAFMPTPDYDAARLLNEHLESSTEATEFHSVVKSILADPDEASAAYFIFLAQTNLHEGGKSFVGSQLLPGNYASLGCSQSHPLSRGSTHISSPNPDAMPTIDPRYLSHPADLEIMALHVQALDELRHTKELTPLFKPNGKRNHPDAFNVGSLEGAKKYVVDTATTAYHTCGTTAMLPKDQGGVVDTKLRVYETKDLRIVDASIFPVIPRGNIMSSVYAVAEKAADILKDK